MAINMYIKFETPNIAGSGTGEHAGEIEVLSWSHGFQQPTGRGREQTGHESLSFTKYMDASSTELLRSCWEGRQFGKVTLRCYRPDGSVERRFVEYLSVVLEHVVISDFKVSGGPGDIPVEHVSLDYGLISYHYTEQHPAGERLHSVSLAKEGHGTASE
jgi:type VI secretion system secreted protein Hcp